MRGQFLFGLVTVTLAGCAPQLTQDAADVPGPDSARAALPAAGGEAARIAAATVEVPASGETAPVATQLLDAADDPAIYVRPDRQSFGFAGAVVPGIILGTDKKAGLYVYDLAGKALQFLPDGLLNNVDLRPTDADGFIAGASDRGRMGIALYRYSAARSSSNQLTSAGFIKSDVAEPYGFCMGHHQGMLIAVLIAKDGAVRIYALADAPGGMTGTEIKRFAVGSQSEGCVVDDETGHLYIGEEMKGVWRYAVDGADTGRLLVAAAGEGALVADVEGVTLIEDGAERYLLVSSQGDSAFAVWRLGSAAPTYVGRFRVTGSTAADAVSGTDGLDAMGGVVGAYGEGLVVVQDDVNEGGPQNFKMVDWAAIRAALGLR